VILRCVMIPTINDTAAHFKAIADIKSLYPNISRVDILPYHKLRKRQRFLLVNQREFYEDPSHDLKECWKKEIRALGIRDVYLENEHL
jgi:pyruvate-formate lyase-activating enzyme